MPIPSPLATLYAVLQTVRTSAETNAQLLRKNEAATRAALIDPVLRALGWDTADVRMVEPERTIGGELRVDYLLHDSNGNPRLVVEAKCLGASLDKHGYVSKVLGYALGFKVQTVFITDGLQWHCYANLHKGNTEVVAFSLAEDDLLVASLELIRWLDAARSGHGMQAEKPVAVRVEPAAAAEPLVVVNTHSKPTAAKRDSGFISLAKLTARALPPGQKPRALQLPNGSVVPIKTWKDILVQTSLYVLAQHPPLQIPHPDKAGKKTSVFSWNKPKDGISYKETSLHGRPLFIHTNYSAPDCVANALHVLKLLPDAAAIAVAF